jgi:hypothetical protein
MCYVKMEAVCDVFVITSVTHTTSAPLVYSKVRSIYTTEQRYQQTLHTIESIKARCPHADIILLEASKCDDIYLQGYINAIDKGVVLDLRENKDIVVNHPNKSYSEAMILSIGAQYIRDNYPANVRIFKISGRYYLNDKFNYESFSFGWTVKKPWTRVLSPSTISIWTSTCLYSVGKINEYIDFLEHCKSFYKQHSYTMVDIETLLATYLIGKPTVYLDEVGVSGLVAVNGQLWNH